jgi:hypothetical protein
MEYFASLTIYMLQVYSLQLSVSLCRNKEHDVSRLSEHGISALRYFHEKIKTSIPLGARKNAVKILQPHDLLVRQNTFRSHRTK